MTMLEAGRSLVQLSSDSTTFNTTLNLTGVHWWIFWQHYFQFPYCWIPVIVVDNIKKMLQRGHSVFQSKSSNGSSNELFEQKTKHCLGQNYKFKGESGKLWINLDFKKWQIRVRIFTSKQVQSYSAWPSPPLHSSTPTIQDSPRRIISRDPQDQWKKRSLRMLISWTQCMRRTSCWRVWMTPWLCWGWPGDTVSWERCVTSSRTSFHLQPWTLSARSSRSRCLNYERLVWTWCNLSYQSGWWRRRKGREEMTVTEYIIIVKTHSMREKYYFKMLFRRIWIHPTLHNW